MSTNEKPIADLNAEIKSKESKNKKPKSVPCTSLAWNALGKRLFAGFTDGLIRVWNVNIDQPMADSDDNSSPAEEGAAAADDIDDNDDNKSLKKRLSAASSSSSSAAAPPPAKRVKTEHSGMFVDMRDRDAAASVRRTDARDPRHPQYSYVLCRDAQAAMDSVRSCAANLGRGETCGAPHTISLIMPAEVADGPDGASARATGARSSPVLAEVQCAVMSVARIPVEHAHAKGAAASGSAGSGPVAKYGRVIATVPETGTVIRD